MKRKFLFPFILLLTVAGVYYSATNFDLNPTFEVGDAIDSLNGVVVYYNGAVNHVGKRNVAANGYNIGLEYQCVEFVKRYYFEYYHHEMPDSYGHALDFFSPGEKDGAVNTRRNLQQFTNPSSFKPQVGDLVVMDGHALNPYGHVVIVSAVKNTEVEIIQQNPGPFAPSRITIPITLENERWKLERDDILGYLRKK